MKELKPAEILFALLTPKSLKYNNTRLKANLNI